VLNPLVRAQVQTAVRTRDYLKAEQILVGEIDHHPRSTELLTLAGVLFFMDHKYLNAAIALKKADVIAALADQDRFTLAMSYVILDHRDWARISSYIMVLFGPIALHAAFDFPLLMLQQNTDLDSTARLILGSSSVLVGFSSIAFAVRLVRRVGRHHAPRTDIARERLSQLRRMWALLVFGGGAGFVGLAFVLGAIHRWLINPDRNMTAVAGSVGLISILIGIALLVATTAVYFLGRNRIRASSDGFSASGQG